MSFINKKEENLFINWENTKKYFWYRNRSIKIYKREGEEKHKNRKDLKKGDKVAIVSLSSGIAGDKTFSHRYELGKRRLEDEFGLKVITMPNALIGSKEIYLHPELRADDLMKTFKDKEIKTVFCNLGGDDTIRILPYIDFEILKNNPKIFMGYYDTTINYFMLNKAGVVSFYGPSIMSEFAENVKMHI